MSFDACADFGSLNQTIITGTKATTLAGSRDVSGNSVGINRRAFFSEIALA